MVEKDYYKILEVTPSATSADIKKSYRRLALRYHPDKNNGNKAYEAKFQEIKEAYDILSDLRQRQEYNTRRSYHSEQARRKTPPPPPTTAVTILNQAIEFRKKISVLDPYRMNKLALFQQIEHLLSRPNIQLFRQYNDPKLNKRMIEEIIYCSQFLPFVHVERICFQLTGLAGTDNAMYRRIYKFSKEMRVRTYWDKYKLLIAVAIVLFICIVIYWLSAEPTYY